MKKKTAIGPSLSLPGLKLERTAHYSHFSDGNEEMKPPGLFFVCCLFFLFFFCLFQLFIISRQRSCLLCLLIFISITNSEAEFQKFTKALYPLKFTAMWFLPQKYLFVLVQKVHSWQQPVGRG